jgi:hypothetical protein
VIEIRIVSVDSDSLKSGEPVLMNRDPGQLKSFSQQVEVTKGVNEFEFSFPNSQPVAGKNAIP